MKRAKHALIAAACALSMAAPAHAVDAVSFYFINQALGFLGSKAFGALRGPAHPQIPSLEATLGAAELINDKLPMSTADGVAIVSARAPAPAALELVILAPQGAQWSQEDLDRSWGPGLAGMFCSGDSSLWGRWVAIGGTVGVSVKTREGELARQYGIARSDCEALARR